MILCSSATVELASEHINYLTAMATQLIRLLGNSSAKQEVWAVLEQLCHLVTDLLAVAPMEAVTGYAASRITQVTWLKPHKQGFASAVLKCLWFGCCSSI